MAGPMRDDFFTLLNAFGLETIVESSQEGSLPLGDGPIWLPPGLEAMVNSSTPPQQGGGGGGASASASGDTPTNVSGMMGGGG